MRHVVLAGVVAAVVFGCATGKEEKKVEASSEVIYEEGPTTPPAQANPFSGCTGLAQQGATVLKCGEVTAVYYPVARTASDTMVEQNFKSFDASFPKESTRERFTETLGGTEVKGLRIYEQSAAAPYRAELVVVPKGEKSSLVISCIVSGTTQFERCGKVTQTLATTGVPQNIPGVPPPPAELADGGTTGQDMGTSDGGMMAPAGAGADAGMGASPAQP